MAGIFNDSELILLLLIFAWLHGHAVDNIITAIRGILNLNKLKQQLNTTKTKGLIIKKEINPQDPSFANITAEFLARVSGVQMVLTHAFGSREHNKYTEKHFMDIIYVTTNPYFHTETHEALVEGAKRRIVIHLSSAVISLIAFPILFLVFANNENSFFYIPSSVAGEFYLLTWAFMPITWLLNMLINKYVLVLLMKRLHKNRRVPENDDLVRLDPLRANDVEIQQDEAVDMKVDQVDTHEIGDDSDLQIAMTGTIALSEPAAADINNINDDELPQYESVNENVEDINNETVEKNDGNNEHSDVGKWLKSVGDIFYSDYYELFMDNGFDTMDVVKTLTDNDLENVVGISKVGHRRRLMLEIEKL